jgi:hypothetical protein
MRRATTRNCRSRSAPRSAAQAESIVSFEPQVYVAQMSSAAAVTWQDEPAAPTGIGDYSSRRIVITVLTP